jgi:hypothetical protein
VGQYEFGVNFDVDSQSTLANFDFTGARDQLFGTGTLNVVPEPAAISLLGLGALALLRRRKA